MVPPSDQQDAAARDAVRRAVAQRPDDVARVLLELPRSCADVDELQDLLQRTAQLAVDVCTGASSAGVTVVHGGRATTAAATDVRTLEVDRRQYDEGDGPCLEAARTGVPQQVDVDEAADAYPGFAEAARRLGIRSFLAAPLVTSSGSVGALNLYSCEDDGFDGLDQAVVEVLTRHAAASVSDYLRFSGAAALASQLEEAMRSRAAIEQAKGALMQARRLDAEQAFSVLKEVSQRRNVKLRDVAGEVVRRVQDGLDPLGAMGADRLPDEGRAQA